jgi:hypothetical protein
LLLRAKLSSVTEKRVIPWTALARTISALLEATSLIKPYCVLLIGRLVAAPDHRLGDLRGAGLQAVHFEAPQNRRPRPSKPLARY